MTEAMEVWRTIPWYGGHYEASNMGNIRVKDRVIRRPHSRSGKPVDYFYAGKTLKQNCKNGYAFVHIGFDCKRISLAVHRAVLLAFVGPPKSREEACHNNGNKNDNRAQNLRWDSHYENNQDRKLHGTYHVGEKHPMAKFSRELVIKIRNGQISQKESGVSLAHFYRIKRGESWRHDDRNNPDAIGVATVAGR